MTPARLTETDRAEWAQYARHVVPLPGRARPELSAQAMPSTAPRSRPLVPSVSAPPRRAPEAVAIGAQPPDQSPFFWARCVARFA